MTSRSMGVLLAQRDAELTALRARLAEVEGALRKARVTWVEVSEIDAALAQSNAQEVKP